MSFVVFDDRPLRTREQVAKIAYDVAVQRGLGKLAAVMVLMGVRVEVGANGQFWCPWNARVPATVNFPHDSQSDDNRSSGYLQQQPGPNGEPWWGTPEDMMTPERAFNTFLERLSDNYTQAIDDPELAGQFVQNVQGSAFPDRYAASWDEAWSLINTVTADEPHAPDNQQVEDPPVADSRRPAFNEFAIWSPNCQQRANTPIDLFLIHTQEPAQRPPADNAAEALANWMANPVTQVSYHYAVSQASDGGVTVVDCVDTDLASWSVGAANNRSINLVFANSGKDWSREEWLKFAGNAIDVAAYLYVQDAKKYKSLAIDFIGTGGKYDLSKKSGLADHLYVTQVLKWGDHTDVGSNFPADYLRDRIVYWATAPESQAPPPVVPPAPDPVPEPELPPAELVDPQTEILIQTRGRFAMLGDQTPVEALAELRDHILGTDDRHKTGFRW